MFFWHGDHVPLAVRNAAVVAFWAPDLLGVESQSMRRAEAQEFWPSRVSEFCVIAEYVAKRLAAYYWPSAFELRSQYRALLMHWGRLCAREDVQKHVMVQPQHKQAKTCRLQQKQFTAARQQALLQLDHWREGAWKPHCRLLATRSQQQQQ